MIGVTLAVMRQVSIALTSLAVALLLALPAVAQERSLPQLLAELADPEARDAQGLQNEIRRRWSRSGSSAVDFLLLRGDQAIERGNLMGAVDHFSAAIDHAPDFAEGWNRRATAYFLQGEYGLSIADIRVTLGLNPQHYGALTGLGMILEETGEIEAALAALRMSNAINPHQQGVQEAIARLERMLGSDA